MSEAPVTDSVPSTWLRFFAIFRTVFATSAGLVRTCMTWVGLPFW